VRRLIFVTTLALIETKATERYDVSFEATYDLAAEEEEIQDLRDIRFGDETLITIPDLYP
jgi:hypothetical protein